jgi:hypothetical protein
MLLVFTASTWFLYGVATTDFAVIVADLATVAASTFTAVTLHQRDALPTRTVVATWFVYGVLEANPVVWLPNAVALFVIGVVVAILVRERSDAGVRLAPVGD